MRRRLLRSEYGQTAATYALILGGIALVVIVGVLAFGDTLGGLLDSNGQQLRDAGTPSQPAGPAEPIDFPTTLAECLDPGWDTFPQFESKQECEEYVESL